jgi:uncharacterized coiled-coil protein SlyX
MSLESPPQWHSEDPSLPLPAQRSRWPFVLAFIVILALAGGGAYAWMNVDQLIDYAQGKTPESRTATGDDAVMTDLLAAQQKTNDDLAALERKIADQQQQLKQVTDQLADLTSKLGQLKSVAAAPQVPLPPAPPQPPVVSAQPPAPVRTTPRPKQPPRPAPTAGPISVGGAPLNATAAPGTR